MERTDVEYKKDRRTAIAFAALMKISIEQHEERIARLHQTIQKLSAIWQFTGEDMRKEMIS